MGMTPHQLPRLLTDAETETIRSLYEEDTKGERLPDYFPVDDEHPRRAMRPYGLSKCLAEDLCAGFTARPANWSR